MDYTLIIIGIIIIVVLYIFIIFNKLIKLNNKVNEAFATMDVYLKKRWDLIPNLVEIVKGYSKHEKNTLKEIVELRNNVYENLSTDKKIDTNKKVNTNIVKLIALAESYPDLKADKNYLKLQDELSEIEEEIARSRKYYNATIRDFNNNVQMFPSNLIALLIGYKTKKMFNIEESERDNKNIEL